MYMTRHICVIYVLYISFSVKQKIFVVSSTGAIVFVIEKLSHENFSFKRGLNKMCPVCLYNFYWPVDCLKIYICSTSFSFSMKFSYSTYHKYDYYISIMS